MNDIADMRQFGLVCGGPVPARLGTGRHNVDAAMNLKERVLGTTAEWAGHIKRFPMPEA